MKVGETWLLIRAENPSQPTVRIGCGDLDWVFLGLLTTCGCPVRRKREPRVWEFEGRRSHDLMIDCPIPDGVKVRIVATEILDAEQGEQ